MNVPLSDLPELSKSRLLAATKAPPQHTFVIKESKIYWAVVGICLAIFSLTWICVQADDYRWPLEDSLGYLALTLATFIIGWVSASYIYRWSRSDFKRIVLLNPLYFMRFQFDEIQAITVVTTDDWDLKHLYDRNGRYAGTNYYFKSERKPQILKIKSLRVANDLTAALQGFPVLVSDLLQKQDALGMYSLDLLYEWRMREQQFPRSPIAKASGLKYVVHRLGPSFSVAVLALTFFYAVISPYNNYSDDQLRWNTAQSAATATSYRLYIASRPDGRHVSAAQTAIDNLYVRAASDYRNSAGISTSQGIEAVIKMLEYARRTGHYKVYVRFTGDNEIPPNIDERIRSITGVTQLIPVLPSFTDTMNQAREGQILSRISSSFGRTIPGDILQFSTGQASAEDIGFAVAYLIKVSGDMYYPVKQEHLPEPKRDWYTGISQWDFAIRVPGTDSSSFQLSLASQPADLFNVAYTRAASDDQEMTPGEVYNGMADSAFGDFGSKLLSDLSVR
jgi:hypothetical protein